MLALFNACKVTQATELANMWRLRQNRAVLTEAEQSKKFTIESSTRFRSNGGHPSVGCSKYERIEEMDCEHRICAMAEVGPTTDCGKGR
jgi:hypothetical protein